MAAREKGTRIAQKLRDTESRYRELFDSINMCVAVYKAINEGSDFVIKDFNAAAERVEKVYRRSIIGKSVLEVFPGVKEFGIFAVLQRVWKTEAPERFPSRLYKDHRITGWRDNYIYKLPSGEVVAVYEDTTERMKAVETLQEAELRYRTVADFTYDWEFWTGPDGKFRYMSPSCERITGYPPDTFIKDPSFMETIIMEEDRPQWDEHHERIKAGAVDLCSFRIIRQDGEIRWIEHTCQPVHDERGNFLGTRGSNRDITGRVKAEEQVKENEQKFRAAFSDSQAAISIVTLKEGRYIDVNIEFLRIAESTYEEIIGKTADELNFWANDDQRRQMYSEIREHGRLNNFEVQVRSKSGKILTLLLSADKTVINGELCLISSILDISERKRSEDAIEKSKAKLEAIFENMTDSVFICDMDGNILDFNESFAAFHRFGSKSECFRTRSEYRGYIDFYFPDGSPVPLDMLPVSRAHRGETVLNTECILVKRDTGERWWGSFGFGPVKDINGKIVASVVVGRDITAVKTAQEKLRESEEKYRLLYDNMAQGVVFQRESGEVIFVNPAAEEILGVTLEQLKNPAVIDANVQMYNEDGSVSPADEHPTMKALKTGQEIRDATYRVFNPRQKAWRWISVNATPLFKPGERKPYQAFVTISDITERVKLIKSVTESEGRYRTLFEKTGNPILVIDTEENFIAGNDAALEFLECTSEELLTHKASDFHPSGQTTEKSIWKTGGKIERQYEIKGRIKILELTVTPGAWKGRPAVFGIGTDITERKRLEDANVRTLAEWQNTFDSVSDMLSIHDGDFRLVKVNRAFAEAFKTTADKLAGKHCYEIIHGTDCPVRNCPHTRTMQEGKSFTEEVYEPRLGAYLQVSTSPTFDNCGNVTGCVHIAKDISESKLTEATIIDKEQMLRSILNAITESACLMDKDGTILENNACIAKRLGQEGTDLKGKNIYEMLPPDVAESRRSMVRKAIETRSYTQFEDVRAGRNILNSIYPVLEGDNEVNRLAVFGLDLTEVRQADRKINESEQRSAAAFNIHQDPMAITEAETGRIIDVNPAYLKWTGYSRDELIGRSTRDLGMFVNTTDRDKFVEQVRLGNRVTNMDIKLRLKSGEVRDTLFSASSVEIGGKKLLFTHARDITERVQILKHLEQSEKQYRLLAENTGDVIWTLDTDLKFTYFSPSILRLRGLGPEEAMGETLEECMTPASWQHVRQELERLRPNIKNKEDKTWRIEVEQYHKNGTTIWTESVLRPLYNNEGKFEGLIGVSRDINERKKAELELQDSEEKFRAISEQSNDVVFTTDDLGTITYLSPATLQVFGYKPEEMAGKNFTDFLHPDSFDTALSNFAMALAGEGTQKEIQLKMKRKDGSIFTGELNGGLFKYKGMIGSAGLIKDISERKAAQDLIQQANHKLSDILDFLPDATFACDVEGKVVLWNHAMEQMSGVPASEMIGKGDHACTVPFYGEARPHLVDLLWKDQAEVRAKYPQITQEAESIMAEVFCPALYGGKGAWVFAKASPLHDHDGNIVGAIESIRDINASKVAEQDLRSSEEQYRLLAENTDDVIWTLDNNFNYTYISPSIRKLRGYEPEEAMHQGMLETMTPESAESVLYKIAENRTEAEAGTDKSVTVEVEQFRKDGSTVWVEAVVRALYDHSGKNNGFIGVSRDISDRKREESQKELSISIMDLLNMQTDQRELIRTILTLIKEHSGCQAVGIRLNSGEDYPYYEANGFIPGHVEQENYLCERDSAGNLILDKDGKPAIECMCGNIIRGRTDPSQSFFTRGGSFWSNCTTELLASTTEEDRQSPTRNRCNSEGYESVALIPLKSSNGYIGLIQLNDTRRNMFTRKLIEFYEGIGQSIGIVLARKQAEETALKDETRLESLLKIAQYQEKSVQDLLDFALDEAIRLTDSKIGYIYYYYEDREEFVLNTWSKGIMKECSIQEPQTVYQLAKTGVWGEAVRQRKPVILNDFQAAYPLKKGYPAGHAALYKFLTIPVFSENKIVAVVGVANKNEDYDHDDIRQLTLLMDSTWKIVERRRVEEMLESSETRHRVLLEDADAAIFVVQDGKFKFSNSSAEALTGYSKEEILAMDIMAFFYGPDIQKAKDNYQKRVEGNDALPRLELRITDKSGVVKWVVLSALSTEWEYKPAFIYFIQDISESKIATSRLRASEKRFNEFFEHATNYCYMVSPEGYILDLNSSALDILGCNSKDEVIGRPMITTVYAPKSRDRVKALLSLWEETGVLENEEVSIAGKNGEEREVVLSYTAVKDDDGNLLHSISIQTDITERKRLLEEQARLGKLESVGTLAGGIAHDFNNILGAVLGNISLAYSELHETDAAQAWLRDAEKAVLRAKDLTKQLLTFSRGGTPLKKVTSLKEVITDTARFVMRGSPVKCRFSIQDDLWLAEADEGQIGQVIGNLVINARQAMPAGGFIDIKAENLELADQQSLGKSLPLEPGNYIRIIVQDQGSGIPEEFIPRIFDPYFTTKTDGTGLGLATSFSIIRNHGGHISVDSTPGKGTAFYVYLPAISTGTPAPSSVKSKSDIKLSGKVLVMDDETALRETIKTMLSKIGFEIVETAPNGEEALKLYKAAMDSFQPFDAVLLDLTVPGGMGGKETIEKLLEIDPGVVALVSSGYAAETVMADYKKYGFKGIIAKPFTFDELRSALNQVLGRGIQ